MVMMVVLLVCVIAAGLVVIVRSRANRENQFDEAVPRVSATVGTGGEQIIVYLARVLGVARTVDEAEYGHVYIADSSENGIVFATRSEIGRGFAADLTVRRAPHGSQVEYTVRSLPGDDTVAAEVTSLETHIATALKSLDPAAEIRMPERANRSR
jgi:hypothetical protein